MKFFNLCSMMTLLTFSLNGYSSVTKYEMNKNSGTVKFFALGNPSAIRINGVGTGPVGQLEVETDETTHLVEDI